MTFYSFAALAPAPALLFFRYNVPLYRGGGNNSYPTSVQTHNLKP